MNTQNILFSTLLFLFIFSFPITYGVNSSYIAAIIAFFILACSKKTRFHFKSLCRKKITIIILFFYIIMLVYSSLNTALLEQYDFTMQKTIVNGIFSYLICIIIVSIFFGFFPTTAYLENSLSLVLIFQSIIIIVMLVSPEVRISIQNIIRTEEEINRMAAYDGVRGLGLSGSIAFGLAITMGLLSYIFLTSLPKTSTFSSFTKVSVFILVFIASLSAGRTSILAFIMGFFYLLITSNRINMFKVIIKYSMLFILVITISAYFLNEYSSLSPTIYRYSEYAFQPIINYLETGSFSVSSTERLSEMYFIPDNESTIFVGDGKYSADDGTYYMNTDSGYLRFMLYFGVIGSIIPYSAFLVFCLYSSSAAQMLSSQYKYFFILLILMTIIFHYKAEVIFYNISYMKIVYLIGFYYILKSNIYRT
ncbi:hypothetical protein [Providencia stuartii]|uniref:hypothetical protein n=1 Tax=Providencia stuartii TaxID=588 RepID=UPI0024AB40FE|nr:hypothetical protein [Providencia stuartii]MCX3071628.1 hypothetical protein [Providencia stuartii]